MYNYIHDYTINCNLEKWLIKANINVSYFCDMMEISRTCYYDWINNRKMPSLDKCYHAKDIISFELDTNIPLEEMWEIQYKK